jgi:hypothetical protein
LYFWIHMRYIVPFFKNDSVLLTFTTFGFFSLRIVCFGTTENTSGKLYVFYLIIHVSYVFSYIQLLANHIWEYLSFDSYYYVYHSRIFTVHSLDRVHLKYNLIMISRNVVDHPVVWFISTHVSSVYHHKISRGKI